MIRFEPKRTWVLLGTGDVLICPVTDEDGRKFICLVQAERGPITPLDGTAESGLVREGELLPDSCVLIEATQVGSVDVLIAALQGLREMMV